MTMISLFDLYLILWYSHSLVKDQVGGLVIDGNDFFSTIPISLSPGFRASELGFSVPI
jgi:hypothetical protein